MNDEFERLWKEEVVWLNRGYIPASVWRAVVFLCVGITP
jgi:hypothetical protein